MSRKGRTFPSELRLRAQVAADCAEERRLTVGRLYERVRAYVLAHHGHVLSDLDDTDACVKAIQDARRLGLLDGFRYANCHEVCIVNNVRNWQPKPARQPTEAAPGSPAKLSAMLLRCFAGEELFHPGDPCDTNAKRRELCV